MPSDDLATYETWDMTAPVVPPRSRLFNLSPVGFGTSLVECLTSYFSRVAQAHSVTPGALHHHELMKQVHAVETCSAAGSMPGRVPLLPASTLQAASPPTLPRQSVS